MRKLLATFLILLLYTTPTWAGTDFTADGNCQGAWAMTSGGVENDLCSGGNEDLTESAADDMATSSVIIPGLTAVDARQFTDGDFEELDVADGGSTDISGADQKLTMCVWFNRDSDNEDDALMSKYSTPDDERAFRIQVEDTGTGGMATCNLSANPGDGFTSAIAVTDVNTGEWHVVCCVYNDIDIRIYLDGLLDSGANNPKAHTTGINNSATKFAIGARYDSGAPGASGFDGKISDSIILDRDLSASEVWDISTDGIDGKRKRTIM